MSERKSEYEDLTDEHLRDLEEQMYDDAIAGLPSWFERDKVLWEMNRRGMMDKAKVGEMQQGEML